MKKECKHTKRLAVYGRDEKNWISTLKIRGQMIYICEGCGMIFQNEPKEIKQ